jgi:hypothetical protein
MRAKVILSPSKDGFCGLVDRSKSSFDELRMISRSTRISRFKFPPLGIHYQKLKSVDGGGTFHYNPIGNYSAKRCNAL